jgi:hypothetical protein
MQVILKTPAHQKSALGRNCKIQTVALESANTLLPVNVLAPGQAGGASALKNGSLCQLIAHETLKRGVCGYRMSETFAIGRHIIISL